MPEEHTDSFTASSGEFPDGALGGGISSGGLIAAGQSAPVEIYSYCLSKYPPALPGDTYSADHL